MKILALEFSSAQRGVAVLDSTSEKETNSDREVVEIGGRETRAISMIERALKQAGIEREQIECLAVGLGPGSYTGIRSAIALAQGWELARNVKLLGIGSDEILAAQARQEGLRGSINIIIDAQRNEFYLTVFEMGGDRFERVVPLRLASAEEIKERHEKGAIIAGPEIAARFEGARLVYPSARTLALLARDRTDFVVGEKMQPIYLRQTSFIKAPPSRALPADG